MDFAQTLLDRLVIILMHDGRTVMVRARRRRRLLLRRRRRRRRRRRAPARATPIPPFPPRPPTQGVLKGVDMQTTLVLSECRERIFSPSGGVEEVSLGLYIVRGDQLCVIGEVDEAVDASVDWANTRGEKPEPILVGVL